MLSTGELSTNVKENRAIFCKLICARARHFYASLRGMTYLSNDEQERAFRLLDLALSSSDKTLWIAVRDLLVVLSPLMEQAGLRRRWRERLEQAIALCRLHADTALEGDLSLQLGLQYQLDNQWTQAQAWYEQSIALFGSMPNIQSRRSLIYALGRLAYLHRLQGEITEAEALVKQLQQLMGAKSEGDGEDADYEFAHFVQGILAQYRQEWHEAEKHLRRSLALCKKLGDQRLIAKRLRDLGWLFRDRGALHRARNCFEEALSTFAAIHDSVEQATTQVNLGIVYSQMGQPMLALDLYAEAKKIFVQVGDHHQLANVYNNQGWDYMQIGRWAEAEKVLEAAVALREKGCNQRSLANSLDNLGRVYAHQGCTEHARQTFRRALDALDALDAIAQGANVPDANVPDANVLALRREIIEQRDRLPQ